MREDANRETLLARLEADGIVRKSGDALRTTKRWQGAMARAAFRLYGAGDSGEDLRVPVAFALVDVYGADTSDADIAALVEVMLPIEAAELDPRARRAR